MRRILLSFIGLVVAVSAGRASALPLTVVDADFTRARLDVKQLADGELSANSPGGPVRRSLRDIVLLERDDAEVRVQDAQLTLILTDGQRYGGTAGVFENDIVTWNTPWVGTARVPLSRISRIVRGNAFVESRRENADHDLIHLANGDHVSGIITSIGPKSITCQSSDGQSLDVEWASIREVELASTGSHQTPEPAAWRITLVNGSVCDVEDLSFRDDRVLIRRQGEEFKLAPDTLISIEHLAARAQLLTRRQSAASEYAPYFPRVGSVATLPVPASIAAGDVKFHSFVAVRPYSRRTWNVDPKAVTFKTRYAVAKTGALANCHARVWLDDRMVMDQPNLTGDSPIGLFETDLGGAKTVTLEVDFGENFDVQDQFYWIEPALIEK